MRKLYAAALAITLIAGAATPSFAEGEDYVAGPTASGSWSAAQSRTPLAGSDTQAAPLRALERSGATGNGGQHS